MVKAAALITTTAVMSPAACRDGATHLPPVLTLDKTLQTGTMSAQQGAPCRVRLHRQSQRHSSGSAATSWWLRSAVSKSLLAMTWWPHSAAPQSLLFTT